MRSKMLNIPLGTSVCHASTAGHRKNEDAAAMIKRPLPHC